MKICVTTSTLNTEGAPCSERAAGPLSLFLARSCSCSPMMRLDGAHCLSASALHHVCSVDAGTINVELTKEPCGY
jgi:hypothetical protein